MTDSPGDMEGLVERLLRRERLIRMPGHRVVDGDPVNPDGPEAAARLTALSRQVEEATGHLLQCVKLVPDAGAIEAAERFLSTQKGSSDE